jgi:hypothetical protein
MTVDLPAKLAEDFAALAAKDGRSPEEYLRDLVEREVARKVLPETRAERFARLRADVIASGVPLLDDEQLQQEVRERKGRRPYHDE